MDFPFVKEAVTKLFSKPSCRMYPQVPSEAAPGYRGRIVFHPETCINCNVCERVCAGGAITHTEEKVEEGVKVTRSFDLGSCTFCNTCADFCSRHSIELTPDYHMLGIEEGDLIVSGTFVKAAPKKPAPKPAAPAAAKAAAPAAAAAPAIRTAAPNAANLFISIQLLLFLFHSPCRRRKVYHSFAVRAPHTPQMSSPCARIHCLARFTAGTSSAAE